MVGAAASSPFEGEPLSTATTSWVQTAASDTFAAGLTRAAMSLGAVEERPSLGPSIWLRRAARHFP